MCRPWLYLSALLAVAQAKSPSKCSTSIGPWGSLAADADDGQPVLPNIYDPQAVNAQSVCPGYKASNVKQNNLGFTATLTLAGKACNVYGDDVDSLQLTVEHQSADRSHVEITPTYIGKNNESWFVPPADVMAQASIDSDAAQTAGANDFDITWGNDPSFWIKVTRKSNGTQHCSLPACITISIRVYRPMPS